jgi:sortase (surface protein transpeptidase)
VLLFVVYEVYITDIFSAAKQKEATAALDERWVQEDAVEQTEVVTVTDPNQLVVDPASRTRSYEVLDGEGFAKISIPAFGADYHLTIISGTNPEELVTGPGHYPDSQYPGEQGNFAMAGHRVSKGSPFNNLDQLNSCDAIIIETQDDWFVYRVLPMENEIDGWDPAARANCAGVEAPTGAYAEAGVLGREITLPTDYAQVLPIPHVDSYTVPADAQRLVTLTTCHPQFSDAERMIIHGTLVKTYAKTAGFIPPEMQEG